MKVLMISLRGSQGFVFFNLGLAYLVGSLKKSGIKPQLALMDAGKMNDNDLIKLLDQENYDYICIGFFFENLYRAVELMQIIRHFNPHAKVITGGPAPSSSPEYILRTTNADIAVVGEAELILSDLLNNYPADNCSFKTRGIYYRLGDDILTTGAGMIYDNLDECPLPAYEDFPLDDYFITARPPAKITDRYMPVLTSRGCPYNCNFCYHTNNFRFRTPTNVAEEISLLIERYNISFIQFYDDLFMFSKKRCLEILETFQRFNLKFNFRINGRVNIVDEDLIKALKTAGCKAIGYGIESGEQAVLDYMDKKTTVDQIIYAIELTKKHNISVTTPVMFGQPVDTLSSLEKTKRLLMKIIDGHEKNPRDQRFQIYRCHGPSAQSGRNHVGFWARKDFRLGLIGC